ncbi:hypothetical protein ACFXO2_41470, partial [Streptomyces sp. NPDC059152]|uniref:hypothetical protein n=1 Tax=Streptomyces sp. NPDC059152 TaxID=3346742 RepID=UPI0036895E0A
PAGVRRAVIRPQLLRADLDAPRKQRHTVTWTFHRLAQAPSSFRESAALPRRIYGPELTTSQSISC